MLIRRLGIVGNNLVRFFAGLWVLGVLFLGSVSIALAGQYISVSPTSVRPGESFIITITAPDAPGSWRCISSPGYVCSSSNTANWRQLPTSGTETITPPPLAANTAPGPITFQLHLYGDNDVGTELFTYKDSATLTVLASNVIPPATVTSIKSDLDCPLGLPFDSSTGLCLPTNPLTPATGSLVASSSVGQLIQRFLDILLTLAGVIAILFIVIGGYQYITSRGAEDQAKAGRKTMTYAIIGLIAILLAYTGVNIVVRLITTGTLFG